MILSVQKAMKILAVIANVKNTAVPLKKIAGETAIPKPTCAHILETLCHDGYVRRISQSMGYVLGPALYHLTRYGRYEQELVSLCRPVMQWMEQKSHATVILSVIQNNQKFIISYADQEQNLLKEHARIRTDDIYRTATGRAILSHMDRAEVKAIWEEHGAPPAGHWDEVTSYEALLKALKQLQGKEIIAVRDQQTIGYACPLFRRTTCIGAIGLAWKARLDEAHPEERLRRILQKGAAEIQRRLSYEEE